MYLPNASIEKIKDIYSYSTYAIHSTTEKNDFQTKFMYGFEIIPGIHYYMNEDKIIFIELRLMQCFNRSFPNTPNHKVSSFGISTGIYF